MAKHRVDRVTAAAFLADGFHAGHTSFIAATPAVQQQIIDAMRRTRPAIDDDITQHRLIRVEYAQTTAAQLERWESLFVGAMNRGATLLRVVGDGSGINPAPTPEFNAIMAQYEASYAEFVARRFPVVTLCLYDARLYTGLDVARFLKVHNGTFTHPSTRLLA